MTDPKPASSVRKKKRYDVLVVASSPNYRMPKTAALSFIRSIAARFWVRPFEELVAENWVEVYSTTAPSSHELFTKGSYTGEDVFQEAAIRFGQDVADIGYGPGQKVYFYIEFRGCLFKEPNQRLFKLLKDSLYLQCQSFWREHEEIPKRPSNDESNH